MSAVTPLAARTSPYQGLTSYTARDRPFFFGREHETRIIVANLLATRLTLVYGASGVGKSSLMCAGVVPRLRELAQEGIRAGRGPGCVAAMFPAEANEDDVRRASWQDDPIEGIANAIEDAVAALGLEVEPPQRTGNLTELLADWTALLESDVLLVLDQFEEYFVYHDDEDGDGTLAVELPRALSEATLAANVVISIREDAYTRLDRFKGRLAILYDNYLRVDHLSREGAREAIVRPLEEYRKLGRDGTGAVTIEPALVEKVLQQVQSGAVALGQAGRGSVGADAGGGIETPFLQLVMERLWNAEREAGSDVLRLGTLERLDGARPIVRAHLDDAMRTLDADDQDICARVFGRLVTPSRTKIAYLAADLAAQEGLTPQRLTPVLEDLAAKRILRPVAPPPDEILPRYEIFHDVLAPAVLDWRGRWLEAQDHLEAERKLKADLERQAQERAEAQKQAQHERDLAARRRRVAVVAMVLAALAVVLAVVAVAAQRGAVSAKRDAVSARERTVSKSHDALVAQRRAQASQLLTRANAALARNPTRALAAAEAAVRGAGTASANDAIAALREAVRTSVLVAVMRRGEPVRDAGFNASGTKLFTVAGDRLDLWETRSGRHLAGVRAPHDQQLLDAAFSPDGATLVVGGDGGYLRLWRPSAPGLQPVGHAGGPVLRVAFSRRGRRVLAASDNDNVVRIWSLAAPHAPPVALGLRGTPSAASFSPDGRRVLTADLAGTATIWNARTGRVLHRLTDVSRRSSPRSLRVAAFSGDGRIVVTGSDTTDVDGFPVGYRSIAVARVWSADTGKRGAYIRTHAAITSLAVSHDGRRVVVGTANGSAQVWRPSRQHVRAQVLLTLRGHSDQVSSVAFSPDDRWLVTASGDKTARLWNAATGTLLAQLQGHEDWVGTAAFSRNGDRILTASDDGTARLWRLPVQRPAVTFARAIDRGTELFFDDAGAHALLVTPDWTARVDDAHTGRRVRTFDGGQAQFAALSPDGSRVLTADPGHIASFDVRTGRKLRSRNVHTGVRPVTSDDHRWIALAGGNRLRLWDAQTGRLSRVLDQPRHAKRITAVALNRDGTYAAAARTDKTVTIWNTTTRSIIQTIRHAQPTSLALSPDGSELVGSRRTDLFGPRAQLPTARSLRRTGTTTIAWSTSSGRHRFVLRSHDAVNVQRFSPDGRLIVTAGDENAARVWDARTGEKLAVLGGHTGLLHDAAFSADSRLVVTASDDGTARVWNARTGELLTELAQGARGAAWTAGFTPSGDIFVGSTGRVATYHCNVCGGADQLLARAKQLEPRSSG